MIFTFFGDFEIGIIPVQPLTVNLFPASSHTPCWPRKQEVGMISLGDVDWSANLPTYKSERIQAYVEIH